MSDPSRSKDASPSGSLVFTFSLETMDDAIRREFCRPPDQTLLALARDARVTALSAVDPWRSWPVDIVKRRPIRQCSRVSMPSGSVWRLRPRRFRRTDPTESSRLRHGYKHYATWIGAHLPSDHTDAATLITFHPFVAAWAQAPWIRRRIFVGRDDWASSPRERPWWNAYRDAYREIAAGCDEIFAVSQEVADRLSPERAIVVPNGIDAGRWQVLRAQPVELDNLPRPIGIYAGTVDNRIDVNSLIEARRVLPSIVIAGPRGDGSTAAALEGLPGIHLLGSLSQDQLVAVIQNADVGLIPHRDTPLTRGMSPLKLFEYLGGGIPVVSTNLPPVRDVSERVMLCDSVEEWAPAVAAAAEMGHMNEPDRLSVVASLSWEARLRPIVDAAIGVPPQR